MASLYQIVNQLAMLMVGRNPSWSAQATDAQTGAPADDAAGLTILNSPRVMLHAALRETPHLFTARILIDTADASTSYSLVVNGNAITPVTGEATAAGIIADYITAVGAAAPVDALVTVVGEESVSGGGIDTLLIEGKAEADLTITAAATSGTGALTLTTDATVASLRLWGLPKGAPNWVLVRDGDFGPLDYRGFVERFDTAGFERLYVEVYDEDGTVTISLGPATSEV
jgi:hypothetical protein